MDFKKIDIMLRKFFPLVLLVFVLLTNISIAQENNYYEEAWKRVNNMQKSRLPKSIYSEASKIYLKAKEEKNYKEVIKAISVKYQYSNDVKKNGKLNFLKSIDKEIKGMPFPYDAIMNSFIANMYFDYLSNYSYKIREKAIENVQNKKIENWSINDYMQKIDNHYIQSLKNQKAFKKLKSETYKSIFFHDSVEMKSLNLYELLGKQALKFYFTSLWALRDYSFTLDNPDFFSPAKHFVSLDISEYKSEILKYRALYVLQQLSENAIKSRAKDILVRNQLYRYKLIKNNYKGDNKNTLFIKALEYLESDFDNYELANVFFTHAEFLIDNSTEIMGCKGKEKKYNYRKTAKQLCDKSINRYKESVGAKRCKNLLVLINKKRLQATTEVILPSKETFPVYLKYRNTDTIWVRLWKLNTGQKKPQLYRIRYGRYEWTKKAKLISTKPYALKGGKDYNLHTTELLHKGLDCGRYMMEFSTEKNYPSKQYSLSVITVSDIYYMQRERDTISEFLILNRKTGKPVEGAKLTYWSLKWNRGKEVVKHIGEKISDKNGLVVLKRGKRNYGFKISIGKDTLVSELYNRHSYYEKEQRPRIKIFTDRKIYRPGDKVHFKAILYKGFKDSHKVLENEKIKFEFKDTHYNKIAEQELTTNEFGSVSGSFDIPYNLMTGNYRIRSKQGGLITIRVEEYKVPLFEVKAEKLNKQYNYNDTISVNAQAVTFNNVAVSDAKFEYKVYRQEYDISRPYYYSHRNSDPVFTGKGKTDKDGNIKFSFVAKSRESLTKHTVTRFTYEIAVTDINGETQSVENSFRISSQSLFIKTSIKDFISFADLQKGIEFSAKNIDEIDIAKNLKVELIKLKALTSPLAKRLWKLPSCRLYTEQEWRSMYPGHVYANEDKPENYKQQSTVGVYTINTGTNKNLKILEQTNLQSGPYLLKVAAKDWQGNEVKYTKAFTLFRSKSTKNPDSRYFWTHCSHSKAYPGDTITITYGSSKDINIMYKLVSNGRIIKSGNISVNGNQGKIQIPVEEKHRGIVDISISSVYSNRCYTNNYKIDIPRDNKKLDISFKSFRDKLLPGEKESWTITLKNYKNKFANAEMLATLYDASLDKLNYNSWELHPYPSHYNNYNWGCMRHNVESWSFNDELKYKYYSFYSESELFLVGDEMGYGDFVVTGYSATESKLNYSTRDLTSVARSKGGIIEVLEDCMEFEDSEVYSKTAQSGKAPDSEMLKEVQIRKDFASTAFFYPFLRTNNKGELEIKFTVPESLTRWKMMGMAHTKDLSLGFVERYLETKKDLMVISNAPRFLREGDNMEFTTKVSNLSDKNLSGGIKIEFRNAVTGELIDIVEDEVAKIFTVNKKSNSLISWNITIPEDVSLIKYTVVATNGEFSDGETSVVPVLSKRIMVTKSMPFSVKNSGESLLIVPDLKKVLKKEGVEPYRMTMEFSSNPVWYAVQSLPYLMEYPYECSEQTFSRYFANKLASHIIKSNPKIKEIYDVWKVTASESSETFLSKLVKNKELKQIVIEETPWLAEAKTQEERIKRLGMLFDLNNLSNEESRTKKKLFDNQNSNGGWPWFKDMRSNRFITQHILVGLGYLSEITGDQEKGYRINRALNWAKEQFIKSYINTHKTYTSDRQMNFTDLHFLYMATFYKNMRFTMKDKIVVDFYLNKCEQYWKDASLYQKGLAALVLYRHGRKNAAKAIVASLKEYATVDAYYGMYWKENMGGIYVNKAQIEIQSLMIEVFTEITNDRESVENMKIWLLNHKRTNSWESTKATVCAVYSLLSENGGSFDMDPALKVSVGNKVVFDAAKSNNIIEAGTGYVKKVYKKDEISRDMDKIKIKKSDEKLVWGALYLQYFDNLDNVSASSTGIEIKKQVLVERIKDGKVTYEEINKDTKLNVGDKLEVHLSIKNDFPMEYLHIKDLRASCLEPGFVKSGYGYNSRLYYYISVKDASVNYFIDYLPKGEFSLTYNLRVTHNGSFSDGISTIQCMYAPEFQANSKGKRLEVGKK